MSKNKIVANVLAGVISVASMAGVANAVQMNVNLSALVQSAEFQVEAVPGSIWAQSSNNTDLDLNSTQHLTVSKDKKKMNLVTGNKLYSNKNIKFTASSGKKLQATATGFMSNKGATGNGGTYPIKVTIGGDEITSIPVDIVDGKTEIKAMDISVESGSTAFAEGYYDGAVMIEFSAI